MPLLGRAMLPLPLLGGSLPLPLPLNTAPMGRSCPISGIRALALPGLPLLLPHCPLCSSRARRPSLRFSHTRTRLASAICGHWG